MNRIFHLLAVLLAVGLVDVAAKDKSDKRDKYEKRDEKRDRSEPSGTPEKAVKAENTSVPREPMAKSEGYDAFRNVRSKNIFDPNRRGPRIETPPTATSSPTSSRGRALALTGTMVTDGKALAFFSGSAAEGSRVISVGNSVANYKLTAIATNQVSLEREGKALVLDVGRQISFESTSGEPAAVGPIAESTTQSPTETTGLPTLPAGSGDKSEILRRMMERRAKEGGQ